MESAKIRAENLDRGESLAAMEPLLLAGRAREDLNDLAFNLTQRAAAFRHSLPPTMVRSVAALVRSMNCYYSNLIEGHNTHPIAIERALKSDFSTDRRKRDLQLEARAHIEVQEWIDSGGLAEPYAEAGIREIHRRFCDRLPEDLLWIEESETHERERVVGGKLRDRDVRVGDHIAISPGAVPRFLERFEAVYSKLGKLETVLAAAAAHHRLLWMHPFLDGNGRVARLVAHASLLRTLDTGAIWSVARGLARNVERYKQLLSNCDRPRRNDLDGRGALSESALVEFTRFFLETCTDQVDFMQQLLQPDMLRTRILIWAEEEMRLKKLEPRSGAVLEAILYRGELPRGEVQRVTQTSERQASRIIAALLGAAVLRSESPRGALLLNLPATLATRWMPGLFPDIAQ